MKWRLSNSISWSQKKCLIYKNIHLLHWSKMRKSKKLREVTIKKTMELMMQVTLDYSSRMQLQRTWELGNRLITMKKEAKLSLDRKEWGWFRNQGKTQVRSGIKDRKMMEIMLQVHSKLEYLTKIYCSQ
jgi:hypothetical protein